MNKISSIMTYSGVYFHLPNKEAGTDGPRPFNIVDIAHGLSNLCRYGGQCKSFYSVAEHAVYVARLLMNRSKDQIDAKQGLMHDLSEAYLVDVPRDFKALLGNYKELEDIVMIDGFEFFELPWPLSERVKVADDAVLFETERPHMFDRPFPRKQLDDKDIRHLDIWHRAAEITPKFLNPIEAERLFLDTYYELFYPTGSVFGKRSLRLITDDVVEHEEAELEEVAA